MWRDIRDFFKDVVADFSLVYPVYVNLRNRNRSHMHDSIIVLECRTLRSVGEDVESHWTVLKHLAEEVSALRVLNVLEDLEANQTC